MKRALFLCLFLSGCATNPFHALTAPSEPHKMAKWTQEETIRPRIVGKVDGDPVIANDIDRRYIAGYDETPAKKTIGQRIGSFFASLSIWGLVFLGISLLFFGGAPILWLWAKFLKARTALKRTVAGIEELNAEDKEKVKESLCRTQDTSDKVYIANLKAELKKG